MGGERRLGPPNSPTSGLTSMETLAAGEDIPEVLPALPLSSAEARRAIRRVRDSGATTESVDGDDTGVVDDAGSGDSFGETDLASAEDIVDIMRGAGEVIDD